MTTATAPKFGVLHLKPGQIRALRVIPMWIIGALIAFAVLWVLFLADRSFTVETSAGSALAEPGEFIVTLLDGLTFAGLLFVVSSGFTLIFGLMRTVNMAHGALFLLAAYIAIELQREIDALEDRIDELQTQLERRRAIPMPGPKR